LNFLSPKQIARRAVLAPDALYHRTATHGVARSQLTRGLHLTLLLAVLYQLISSEVIERPLPGEAPSTLYRLHEYIGIGSLGVVCVFWLWTLVRRGETSIASLFPWLSPRAIKAIVDDVVDQIHAILRRDFSGDSSGALASAVHGLGLLIVTAMAATGTVLFFSGGVVAHDAMALHRLIANLMWAYLIGHAGLATLHHLLGSDILRPMFWIRRGITITTRLPVKARLSSEQTRV
jgi:cytochrome b561